MRLHASFVLGLCLCALLSGPAAAQSESIVQEGATSSGLCGLVYTGNPRCRQGLTLSGTGGYGVTQMQGTHHRLIGKIPEGPAANALLLDFAAGTLPQGLP